MGRVAGHTTVRKGGSVDGFSADIALVPSLKLGVALCLNAREDKVALNDATLGILVPIFDRLRCQETPSMEATQPEWNRYAGRYGGPVGAFAVRLAPRGLVLALGAAEVPLLPAGEDRFRMQGGPFDGEQVRFILGNDGQVSYATSSGHRFDREGAPTERA